MANNIRIECVHDSKQIFTFLNQDPGLHLYAIGDLDEFFWQRTQWFGLMVDDQLEAMVLLYYGHDIPVLLALSQDTHMMAELLHTISAYLPGVCYCHISRGAEVGLKELFDLDYQQQMSRMILQQSDKLIADTSKSLQIGESDIDSISKFYAHSYPDNWLDSRMIRSGTYYGIKQKDDWASVAGTHVFSPKYGVAAIGNVTTSPHARGQGFAQMVTSAVCQKALAEVEHIGLNVGTKNIGAIKTYQAIGFDTYCHFDEFIITRK